MTQVLDNSASPSLDPRRVRAARALLAWSQQDLAKAAGVATSTVADFERGQRTPVANNAEAIRSALESAGVQLLPTGAIVGPPLPVPFESERPGLPMRWVDSDDLEKWADRTDAVFSLPTLLDYLIRASKGATVELRFPADGGVRRAGWDGVTKSNSGSSYIPTGVAGWELTVQRSKLLQKANDDYQKRTAEPGALDPANSCFVFVTLRHWPKKDEWAKQRQSEGPWREVRVLDAADLVHWIEQTPAVGLWLARRLNKRPDGTRELAEVWEEWSQATELPLTEDLVLSDRDEDTVTVLRWLRGPASVLDLQATTTEEVLAFFHATLTELPEEHDRAYRTRCLVVATADAARLLAQADAPLILLLTAPDPGIARTLAQRGHYVLQAHDDQSIYQGARSLARPSREGIENALKGAGFPDDQASGLARDCARNLTVLRRLIPPAPGRRPAWADSLPRALRAALLIVGWDQENDADCRLLSELADCSYETVIRELMGLVGDHDSPLQQIGSAWRLASPRDAWALLARLLTKADLDRFEASAYAVLGSADPRFDLDPSERWMANVHQVRPRYSRLLRQGVGQVLVSLAVWGTLVRTVPDAADRPQVIVRKLLRGADARRWWSLSSDFRLLAEAAPAAFLDAIEESLDQEAPPIAVLFGCDEDGMGGTEYLADLMWALESLAWSPDWLPRVSLVLARLDALDTKPRRTINGPANSLVSLHLLGLPQTYAPLSARLKVLDQLRKKTPEAAWKLMMGLLPKGGTITMTPTPKPRWRDFSIPDHEPVTHAVFRRGALAISDRLVEDVGLSAARWSELLAHLEDFWPDPSRVINALDGVEPQVQDQAERALFWNTLRGLLHQHRQFPEAEWSLPEDVLARLESVYDRFAPMDVLTRMAWLFQHRVELPHPFVDSDGDWRGEERQLEAAQRAAVQEVYTKGGVHALLELARMAEAPGYIGKAFDDLGWPESDVDVLLDAALRSTDENARVVGRGLIVSLFSKRGQSWAVALFQRAIHENWGGDALRTVLEALPPDRWVWDLAACAGGEVERLFWRRMSRSWMSDDPELLTHVVRKLVDLGFARQALAIAGPGRSKLLPSGLLVELLNEAVAEPTERDNFQIEPHMSEYFVTQILKTLDHRDDVQQDDLARLEWRYLPLLQHSRRPAKALMKTLAEDPSFFVQMLTAVFKASEESGVVDPEPEDADQAKAAATQAYRLLELWSRIPGTQNSGVIDSEILEKWIKDARALAKTAGRERVADGRIGNMLSASPEGADGAWPAEAVRDMLDLFHASDSMSDGFVIGKMNRRGVTTRMPRDGGALERREAAKFRGWAKAVRDDHPHTAKALDRLAESYERDALRHDESARRLDWEG